MNRRTLLVPVAALAILHAGIAGAQSVDEQVTALEAQIAQDERSLATADCTIACSALGSMRRSSERICSLDPGPRCEAARARVEDAARRVREACPQCDAERDRDMTPVQAGAARPAPEEAATPARAAPDASQGGCAGCVVGDGSVDDAIFAVLGAALALLRRRRRPPNR